ncbi:dTDP-4-dehydrorhamnose reductase [Dietzia sp. DQ11-71]|nr:dTDP-4-dehydrorhamnose reductase [Dietzia sp. DQ11-71]MBB1017336.1 dTDP-4-dehydrorhamnose reductase [Dietzia sp. DQ11-71]
MVAGGSGQVGRWLSVLGESRVHALSSAELDVTDVDATSTVVNELRPEYVVNCAAHTAVDLAEEEPARASAINGQGAENLARAATSVGSRFIQVSTDYVFGEAAVLDKPLAEDHPCFPLSVYGRTKLAAEVAVRAVCPEATIVRTAWVYTGPSRKRLELAGNDFVTTMLALEASRDTISVVDDQIGSPTFAHDLAAGLLELTDSGAGVGSTLHAAGGGQASWCDLARAVFEEIGADPGRVHACTTDAFPRPAPRPAFSVLSSAAWEDVGLAPLRDWREAVSAAVAMS